MKQEKRVGHEDSVNNESREDDDVKDFELLLSTPADADKESSVEELMCHEMGSCDTRLAVML